MTSSTSGSCAVLSMTVRPGASDAAMIRFSVPVCDGVSRYRCAPCSLLALMRMTVLALVDDGAEPGEAPVVEVQVPAAQVAPADALDDGLAEPVQQRRHEQHRAAEPAGDLGRQHRAGQVGRVDHQRPLGLVELTTAPTASASSTARRTSSIGGTSPSTVWPLAVSNDAAIIFSAAFFAPCTKTVPCSGAPPRTR